jgi:hypothetical protein
MRHDISRNQGPKPAGKQTCRRMLGTWHHLQAIVNVAIEHNISWVWPGVKQILNLRICISISLLVGKFAPMLILISSFQYQPPGSTSNYVVSLWVPSDGFAIWRVGLCCGHCLRPPLPPECTNAKRRRLCGALCMPKRLWRQRWSRQLLQQRPTLQIANPFLE